MFQNVQICIHLKMFKKQQTMRSMLSCVTQNNNSSLGNTHVAHI